MTTGETDTTVSKSLGKLDWLELGLVTLAFGLSAARRMFDR